MTDVDTSRAAAATALKWNQLYFDNWVAAEGLDLLRGHLIRDVAQCGRGSTVLAVK